jgi:hypothetical protein
MTRSLSVCLSLSAIDNHEATVGKPWDLSPFVIDQLGVIGFVDWTAILLIGDGDSDL